LCVKGTGKPWNPEVQKHADASLARFRAEWDRYLRGDLPVKDDVDVTATDIATKHLILFGDPGSNSLIEQALDGLPLTWSRQRVSLGGREYGAADHVPVMIYPSPLNQGRYVVLNAGHKFPTAAFETTNA